MKSKCLLVLVLFFISLQSLALTPEEIASTARRSTVAVSIDATGRSKLGAGFITPTGYIVTLFSVIDGFTQGHVFASRTDSTTGAIKMDARHVIDSIYAIDAGHNLAIVKTPSLSRRALRLGNSNIVHVGQTVYRQTISLKDGEWSTELSTGVISAIRQDSSGLVSGTVFQVDIPRTGRSGRGSPMLDSNGEVIGVYMPTAANGQDVNYVIPVNYLRGVHKYLSQDILLSITGFNEMRSSTMKRF